MRLRIGDRVTTSTKWNVEGQGTGYLIGVEVPDEARPGHLRHETDPDIANELLKEIGVPDEDGIVGICPRLAVKVFDPDGKVHDMYGYDILCFYNSDNVRLFEEGS